ncbi:hypothetical protein Tco_1574203, partial [Tanacetum coccineum]
QAMLEQRLSFRLCGVERYYVREMPKLAGGRLYTRNICVEYEWKPLKCACYDEGKPMKNVNYLGDHDSEDEVERVDNGMASFMVSERVGYGTNSL